jgi:hypothetical protein
MFNNEVTYHDKWKTPENEKALAELERKYFSKSECSPDCPLAWAPEVLEMMDLLQKELGFKRNESTMRGYYIRSGAGAWFIVEPWKNMFHAIKTQLGFGKHGKYREKNPIKAIGKVISSFFHSYFYGAKALKIKYVNPILNKIDKPKITLGQLKEKYGTLHCYFHTPDAYEEYVEKQVRICEIKIAMKGAYTPLESFWDAGVSYNIENEYNPDSVSVTYGEYNGKRTVTLKKTTYRKVMKEMGIDLQALQQKIFEDTVLKNKDQDENGKSGS